MNTRLKRMVAATIGLSLLAVTMAAPTFAAPPGSDSSRSIVVTGVPTFSISVDDAETLSVPISITVRNDGKQTVNDVNLYYGLDDDQRTLANGDATPPVPFGTDISVPADDDPDAEGITVVSGDSRCSDGTALSCALGTLRAGRSATVSAVINVAPTADIGRFDTEAVVSVAEGGGDAGANIDTFSQQGAITTIGFDCDTTTAYRPGNSSKEVSTCELGDAANANSQSAKVKIPERLSTVVLSEVTGAVCPAGYDCLGDLVVADVTEDAPSDVIVWTLQYRLNGQSVNLQKLSVYHTDDDGTAVIISLAKKNACKTATSVNCGAASQTGDILTITFQTAGNGSSRTLRG